MMNQVRAGWSRLRPAGAEVDDGKFGTFAGVFTPTILTILGAIMYLRLGWVVGNAGLGGALIIIILAHVITISTGLSVSSIATNTRVGAGGAFSIISQSLGLEVGGSVGLPLFLAQSVSIALYVLAFAEAIESMLRPPTDPLPPITFALIAIASFLVVYAIAYRSAQFAARMQFVILAIVGFSLVAIFLGSFPIGDRPGLNQAPVLWGEFAAGGYGFWGTFAVFFPAVTGIMAGVSLSGVLRDARRSLPLGTMSAILLAMIIYLVLAYWISRAATPAELLSNNAILVDKAFFGWAVLAGMLGATFSSALGSLVAAPRVFQAIASFRMVPYAGFFARESADGEPRPALWTTGIIALATLIIALLGGGLNAVAGVITMFFLITYAMLNVVVLVEQTLSMVSFRPTFRIPIWIPFMGMAGCLFVMFLVNPIFGLVALILVLGVYVLLARSKLGLTHNDVRSGLFGTIAEWAAVQASRMPSAPERSWKPTVLAPVASSASLAGAFRFLLAMTYPQGAVQVLGIHPPGQERRFHELGLWTTAFMDEGIYARKTLLAEADFVGGVRSATQVLRTTLFRPNVLFLQLRPDSNLPQLQQLVDETAAYSMGIVLLARHEIKELGREQVINVWVSNQGPEWKHDLRQSNMDLALLLAYQLGRNWRGRINLCMAVADEATAATATWFVDELIRLARLPSSTTRSIVLQAAFTAALAQAPTADLNIFGLPQNADLTFSQRIVAQVDASCVFVRDSGEESALA